MAIGQPGSFIFDDGEVIWNGVDLSARVRSVSFPISIPENAVGAMGQTWEDYLFGKPNAQITVAFYQDYYTGMVDLTLRPDALAGTKRTMSFKPYKGQATGATNRKATFTAGISNYPFAEGEWNTPMQISVTFRVTTLPTFSAV